MQISIFNQSKYNQGGQDLEKLAFDIGQVGLVAGEDLVVHIHASDELSIDATEQSPVMQSIQFKPDVCNLAVEESANVQVNNSRNDTAKVSFSTDRQLMVNTFAIDEASLAVVENLNLLTNLTQTVQIHPSLMEKYTLELQHSVKIAPRVIEQSTVQADYTLSQELLTKLSTPVPKGSILTANIVDKENIHANVVCDIGQINIDFVDNIDCAINEAPSTTEAAINTQLSLLVPIKEQSLVAAFVSDLDFLTTQLSTYIPFYAGPAAVKIGGRYKQLQSGHIAINGKFVELKEYKGYHQGQWINLKFKE